MDSLRRVDPTVNALLGQIRSSTAGGGIQTRPTDPNREDFSFVGQGGQNRYFTTVRLDYNLTDKHSLWNVWNYQEFGGKPVDFLNQTDPAFPGFPNSAGQNSQRWTNTTGLRSTLTPTLINEARFGMLGGISHFGPITSDQFSNQGGFDLNLYDLAHHRCFGGASFPTEIHPGLRRELWRQPSKYAQLRLCRHLDLGQGITHLQLWGKLQFDQDI